jgi:hypothetical protein
MTELINKYKLGKIYKIEPICDHIEGDIYIGSTCQPYLSSRMSQHRQLYKINKNLCNIVLLFDKYGVENCNIILIESIEANNKMELQQREAHFIKTLKCVNKCIPLQTQKEWCEKNTDKIKEKNKKYREDNKNKIKEYNKINKDAFIRYDKKYKEVNRDKINKRKKEYRDANKDILNARQRERRKKLREDKNILN